MKWTALLSAFAFSVVLAAGVPGYSQVDPVAACRSNDGVRSDNEAWTSRSWGLFNSGDYRGATANVNACLETWSDQAVDAQKAFGERACPPVGPASAQIQSSIHLNGVLNDVATNYWILGNAQQRLGNPGEARKAYQACAELKCARTWDPRGWFWDPAADCSARARRLN